MVIGTCSFVFDEDSPKSRVEVNFNGGLRFMVDAYNITTHPRIGIPIRQFQFNMADDEACVGDGNDFPKSQSSQHVSFLVFWRLDTDAAIVIPAPAHPALDAMQVEQCIQRII